MTVYISPLDRDYVSLKRAALLIARDRAGIEPDEIMDLFKHAIFNGDFDWPLVGCSLPPSRIELPNVGCLSPRLAIAEQPQAFYDVRAATIADLLMERGALPGNPDDWTMFADRMPCAEVRRQLHHNLAHIRYTAFPAKAQTLLGDIRLSRTTLKAWMVAKGYRLPAFLQEVTEPSGPPTGSPSRPAKSAATARGRPSKAAWPAIKAYIRKTHAANPKTPLGALAFDAHKAAAATFARKDLPSIPTIQRQMKHILNAGE